MPLKLIRYGTLNPIKQKHYTSNYKKMSYHGAPERYGFYSFLYPYIELFLLGGTGKDPKITPQKKFAVDGYIWTHIECKNYVEQRGSWYKVHSKDFLEYFSKFYAKEIGSCLSIYKEHNIELCHTIKNPYRYIAKDHLEIFVPHYTKVQ